MNELDDKYKLLVNCLEAEYVSYKKVLIALSGGVDSCLAAFLGRKFLGRDNAIAVISNSASLKERDYNIAVDFCNTHDIQFEVIYTKELENENYISNPNNRCFFCKNELYDSMSKLVNEKYNQHKIINGNNYSDLGDYRPGLKAAADNNAFSPFINCKVSKQNIRDLALHFKLSVWDKPASPCLSSRFPYGESISEDKLKRVEKAETILNKYGFDDVRVRSYGEHAKIEVPKNELGRLSNLFSKIEEQIIGLGFNNCEIDNEGFVSGKMNRVLK